MTEDYNGAVATVTSPCIRNCCLDDQDICLGCYRTMAEITGWTRTGNDERRQILIRCRLRQEQRQANRPLRNNPER